jgi:hypothetical protein
VVAQGWSDFDDPAIRQHERIGCVRLELWIRAFGEEWLSKLSSPPPGIALAATKTQRRDEDIHG